ncbi:MAG: hypothetical protein NC122_09930 [Faecalibacterium sp.]|nr:hypothetical protein [Ruminococcus sp.]MCM1393117.1 hypothetical protein [Ruminococcus sp.]MCM1486508.1 hypothetical protein [Faecalibacterium sp.]
MRFSTNRNIYIKRLIFAVLFVITAAVQHTGGLLPVIGSAHAMLLIPLTVSVAMFEQSVAALIFGVFAGFLWDMASVNADGYFAVFLAVTGFTVSLLMSFVMRNNFLCACLVSATASILCNVGYWLFFIVIRGYDSPIYLLMNYYLPSAIYTAVLIPIYYFLIRGISNLMKPEKQRVNY